MITTHKATDVPRDTRILYPEEHAGKLIKSVTIPGLFKVPGPYGTDHRVHYETDQGIVILPAWQEVTVEHGPERERRVGFARAMLSGDFATAAELAIEIEKTDHGEDAENTHREG